MPKHMLSVFVLVALAPIDGAQAVNKCTAPDGKIYYQDLPCPNTAKSAERLRVPQPYRSAPPGARVPARVPAPPLSRVVMHERLDRTLDKAKIRIGLEAQEMVKRRLKDPYSAKFSPIVIATLENGELTACGLVNSKNSFGAYTGNLPWFYIAGAPPMLPSDMEKAAFEAALAARCLK